MKLRFVAILMLFIVSAASLSFALLPMSAFAEGANSESGANNGEVLEKIFVKLQVPLPFVETKCEGGKAVCDLADYIQGVYRLLVGLGALFAVVMIVIAGYQWMLSGGSPDKTGAAKKRIFGAVIGLMLALISYIILNAITPRLVELRMPVVKTIGAVGFSQQNGCNDPKNSVIKSYCKESANCLALKTAPTPSFIYGLDNARCGDMYYVTDVPDAKGATNKNIRGECAGDLCFDDKGRKTGDACVNEKCLPVYLYGNISWVAFSRRYVDVVTVVPICDGKPVAQVIPVANSTSLTMYKMPKSIGLIDADGTMNFSSPDDPTGGISTYEVRAKQCGEGFNGFVLKIEVNDSDSTFDPLPTDDNLYAMGRDCERAIFDSNIKDTVENRYEFDSIDWPSIPKERFFTLEDFDRGYQCDIDTSIFPDYD